MEQLDKNDNKVLQTEIEILRQEVSQLKGKLASFETGLVRRKYPRSRLDADVEFVSAFDLKKARGIDISDGGICIEHSKKIPFELLIRATDGSLCRRAELVWVKQCQNGNFRFGFQFVAPEEKTNF